MVAIRYARESEIRLLTAIGLRAWEEAVAGLADIDKMRQVAERAFETFLAAHWHTVLTVENDGAICGWAAREDNDGHISDLWIDPALQGHGFGSALLSDLERRILAEGFGDALIKTHAQNARAIAFFRKHGYSINWLSTAYAPKLDRNVESIGMTKPFERPAVVSDCEWF